MSNFEIIKADRRKKYKPCARCGRAVSNKRPLNKYCKECGPLASDENYKRWKERQKKEEL